jgi:surface protein
VELRNASDNSVLDTYTASGTSVSISYDFSNIPTDVVVVALANSAGSESAPSATLIVGEIRFPAPVRGTVSNVITDNVPKTSITYTVVSGVIAIQTNNASAQTSLSGTTATVVFTSETMTVSVSALGNGAYATSLPDTYTLTTIPKIQISGYDGSVTSTVVHNATFGSLGTGNFGFSAPRGIAHFYENTGTDIVPVIRRFLFVSNSAGNNVKVYSNASSNVASLSYHSVIGSLYNPSQIACFHQNDAGTGSTISLRMAVADSGNHRIMIYNLVVDANGVLTINLAVALGVHGSGSGAAVTTDAPQFNNPQGVAYTRSGTMYVADTNNHRIQVITTANILVATSVSGIWGTQGTGPGQFNYPSSIAVNAFNNIIVGCNNGVQIFTSARTFVTKISTIVSPSVAVDNGGVGKIIVTNPALNQVHVFSSGGAQLITTFGSGLLNNPSGVTVDNYGNIYVCDRGNNRIQYFESVPSGPTFLSVTYSETTASMIYTVGSSVSAVEVRKSPPDNTVISGVTFSINGTMATITMPFTDAVAPLSIVVVALTNQGVASEPSATLTLPKRFAAPTLNGSIAYSGNTANMTYNVADGVIAVQVRNATTNAVITSTTSVNATNGTASVSVNLTQNVRIVVVAVGNLSGRESLASVGQDLTYTNLSALLTLNGETIKYTGSAAIVPADKPLFILANLRGTTEWFAVVNQGMKDNIRGYIEYYSEYTDSYYPFFKRPSSSLSVVFNNIVTTLMTDMDYLAATTGFNGPIMSWDTSNVTAMNYMFYNTTAFNRPIGSWNTAAVKVMTNMFQNATAFNQPINSWNTAAVINMRQMFQGTTAFNQPLDTWNTAAVNDMRYMFYYATAFTQNISNWVINSTNDATTTNFGHGSGMDAYGTNETWHTWLFAPPEFRNVMRWG